MQHELIDDLCQWEASLGAGRERNNPLSWQYNSKEGDEKSVNDLKAALYRLNFHQVFVPHSAGGLRRNWLQLWLQVALAARRNINVMPAVMYSVGPAAVLELVGSETQRDAAFSRLAEGEQFCFGLSEAVSGTELLKIATRAQPSESGWRITGHKGPLGWSPRAQQALILARTGDGGPESLSFFQVPLDTARVHHYHGRGMLGQQFVDLEFDGLPVGQSALVGDVGRGFETTLKVQQLVKYLSTAANVGGCHSLVRDLAEFARTERHQRRLSDYAHVRCLLAQSVSDLLLAEAAALSAGCLIGAKRSQFSIASSVAKQVALQGSDAVVMRLRDIISVNYALDREPIFHRFHKVADDLSMVRYIDTNPVVNLKNIATQLPAVQAQWQRLDEARAAVQLDSVLAMFNLERSYFAGECLNLSVTNARGDWVISALRVLARQPSQDGAFAEAAGWVDHDIEALWQRLSNSAGAPFSESAGAIELAQFYSRVHACASLLLLGAANPSLVPKSECLRGLIAFQLQPDAVTQAQENQVFEFLTQALDSDRALSLLPLTLNEQ